jgi:type VI protein secretion system component VasF
MENIISLVASQDWLAWLGALTALLGAVIAIAQLIPGEEPERTLQKVVDLISRFSRK